MRGSVVSLRRFISSITFGCRMISANFKAPPTGTSTYRKSPDSKRSTNRFSKSIG